MIGSKELHAVISSLKGSGFATRHSARKSTEQFFFIAKPFLVHYPSLIPAL
jgi:hypothetical protein